MAFQMPLTLKAGFSNFSLDFRLSVFSRNSGESLWHLVAGTRGSQRVFEAWKPTTLLFLPHLVCLFEAIL